MLEKTEKSFPPYSWLKPAAVSSVRLMDTMARIIMMMPLSMEVTMAAARPPSLLAKIKKREKNGK